MIETANDNAVFERTAIVNDGSDRTIDLVLASDGTTAQIQNRYTHGGQVDEPLSLEAFAADGSFDQAYTYHADHLGSIRFVTDSVGNIANAYEYDSYGRPGFAVELVAQPFRYTGREWDQATELYHYRARQYDPETGRFLQEDPIGFAAGDLNVSRYVGSNPLSFTDPTGLAVGAEYLNSAAATGRAGSGVSLVGFAVRATFFSIAAALAVTTEEWTPFQDGRSPRFRGDNGGPPMDPDPGGNGGPPAWAIPLIASGALSLNSSQENRTPRNNLAEDLAFQQGVSQLILNGGRPIAGAGASSGKGIKDINRLVNVYGGTPNAWSKVAVQIHTPGGLVGSVHAYSLGGRIYEPKFIIGR